MAHCDTNEAAYFASTAPVSGNSLGSPGSLHRESDDDSQPCEHVDERIHTEKVDSASQKVTHSWLRYAHDLRSLLLSEPTPCDDFVQLDHEVCTHTQVFRLLGGEG